MKGKYANAAEKRREMDSLTTKAATAVQERDQFAAKLADTITRYDQVVADLKIRIATLEHERDDAVSPLLTATQETLVNLKKEVNTLRKQCSSSRKTNLRLATVIAKAAKVAGFTEKDAAGGTYGLWDPDDSRPQGGGKTTHGRITSGEHIHSHMPHKGASQDFKKLSDRSEGFSDLTDVLAIFYDVLATGDWRQEGSAFIVDDWFARTRGNAHCGIAQ